MHLHGQFEIFPQSSCVSVGAHLLCVPFYIPLPPSPLPPIVLQYCAQSITPFLSPPPFFFLRKRLTMASEPDVSEISSLFERLFRYRELSLFLPLIFGFSTASPRRDNQDPDQETTNAENTHGERVILISPFTQGMVVIDGTSSLETLLREMGMKGGQRPASKESIDAMPCVEIGEGEDGECVICLEEWEVGGMAKEMPCKHKFHQNCIEKWLGIHGSCPLCRYQMPQDEKEVGKRDEEEGGGGGERRRVGREVWVSFSFRSGDTNQAPFGDSTDSSSSSRGDADVER